MALRWLLTVLLLGSVALAGPEVEGWAKGRPARATAQVIGAASSSVKVALPRRIAREIKGPTLLIYFSPTCPHCQQAQPELRDLQERLAGRVQFLGVGSGAASSEALDAFAAEYAVGYPLHHDADRAVAGALGARSTPSLYLIEPEGRELVVRRSWAPFRLATASVVELGITGDLAGVFRPGEYKGDRVCAACHVEEFRSHALTSHSVAWPTLQRIERDEDPACVSCHVTGHGTPGGWEPGKAHLTGVGCEACHGPGGPHDGERAVATEACEACHDAKHSIAFSVEKGLPHIDHFAANALDERAFRARLRALFDGEKERPLLAFAEGPLRGSQPCRSCHEQEHDWWQKDPHGRAMSRLVGREHEGRAAVEQVACVRCHASSKHSGGPPPATLDGYRLDEGGVGCESCHGPGGEHIDSGGAPGTIEGLGEECPVCVVEALCTSCHTAEWDPKWSLDERLDAVRHLR